MFQLKVLTPSDINEHLLTLKKYASEVNHITECGVRGVVSSYAFGSGLLGKENNKLVQIDLFGNQEVELFQQRCKREGINSLFYEQSDLDCPLEDTELLFIDTWHVYGHLKRELSRWHPFVKRYIILHDTTVDEWIGESIRCGYDVEKQVKETGIPKEEILRGLWPAVQEFLENHSEWSMKERFFNNNGLTVLERRS